MFVDRDSIQNTAKEVPHAFVDSTRIISRIISKQLHKMAVEPRYV